MSAPGASGDGIWTHAPEADMSRMTAFPSNVSDFPETAKISTVSLAKNRASRRRSFPAKVPELLC
jgi:hypothetical protein